MFKRTYSTVSNNEVDDATVGAGYAINVIDWYAHQQQFTIDPTSAFDNDLAWTTAAMLLPADSFGQTLPSNEQASMDGMVEFRVASWKNFVFISTSVAQCSILRRRVL